ncbi:MAG: deoxyribodipyrimidine photo-lyase [Granulosicoccus sp.]
MSTVTIGIVWFRQDLRLEDNPALTQACEDCTSVICIFVDDPLDQCVSRLGGASRVWLHHGLDALDISLQKKGNRLLLAQGDSLGVLQQLIKQSGATRIYWNRCYDPVTIARDKDIKAALKEVEPATYNGLLIFEPWENLKGDGTPYRVYTPFWRAAASQIDGQADLLAVLKAPRKIPALSDKASGKLSAIVSLDALALLPDKPWHKTMMSHWKVGEVAARKTLSTFLKKCVHDYNDGRNLPARHGTSKLSPHLHFGEVSPRTVLKTLLNGRRLAELSAGEETFAKEIVWREFAYALIFHYPHTISEPLDVRFAKFEWARDTDGHLRRWQQGGTGVPIVDAGMRELYATGWMHNRVRMIVASYLIKNLLIPWQSGEAWFRDTLVDADLASNAMGWQWTAGSGADAAPFFRVFNPVLQGEKFDRDGNYVRRWVPELSNVANKFVHKPWELPEPERSALEYPDPLVDLKETRQRALAAFAKIKGTK